MFSTLLKQTSISVDVYPMKGFQYFRENLKNSLYSYKLGTINNLC